MRRRELLLLVGGTITVARTLRAQQPTKIFRLGMIVPSRPLSGTRAFEEKLRELGYEEGRNLQLDFLQLFSTLLHGSGRDPV